MWIGYDGDGTRAASPGCSSVHIRWEKPSLAPMVLMTSVSGSRLDAEAAQVEVGDGLAQLRDAPAGRVAVVPGVVDRLGQLLDGDVGRRQVGVAEPEVDHVDAGPPGLDLQRVDDGEDVRRQRGDPAELHGGHGSRRGSGLRTPSGDRVSAPARSRAQRAAAPMAPASAPQAAASTMRHRRPVVGGQHQRRRRRRGSGRAEVAGLGQAPPDHHHLGIEQVHEVGHAERDPPGELGASRLAASGSPSAAAAA